MDANIDREKIIRSSITPRTYRAIYRLLDMVNVTDSDCGELCGAACCGTKLDDESADDYGIYMLPGEDRIHDVGSDGYERNADGSPWLKWEVQDTEDYEFPDSWSGGVCFAKCLHAPTCPRNLRPIQCRTFPLAPHFMPDGQLVLIAESAELPYSCPLLNGARELDPRFVQATYTVWKHLVQDPLIADLVESDSEYRFEEELPLRIICGPEPR